MTNDNADDRDYSVRATDEPDEGASFAFYIQYSVLHILHSAFCIRSQAESRVGCPTRYSALRNRYLMHP